MSLFSVPTLLFHPVLEMKNLISVKIPKTKCLLLFNAKGDWISEISRLSISFTYLQGHLHNITSAPLKLELAEQNDIGRQSRECDMGRKKEILWGNIFIMTSEIYPEWNQKYPTPRIHYSQPPPPPPMEKYVTKSPPPPPPMEKYRVFFLTGPPQKS